MPEPDTSPPRKKSSAAACQHDYELDKDLQMWVCTRCGTSLDMQTQVTRHECGPDCDIHGDISAIG